MNLISHSLKSRRELDRLTGELSVHTLLPVAAVVKDDIAVAHILEAKFNKLLRLRQGKRFRILAPERIPTVPSHHRKATCALLWEAFSVRKAVVSVLFVLYYRRFKHMESPFIV